MLVNSNNQTTQPSLSIANLRLDLLTLITVDDIKTYCPLQTNIEPSQLKPSILLAEQKYLKPILGSLLFNELLNEFVTVQGNPNNLPDGSTFPNATNYKQLYKELFQCLIWASYYESLSVLGFNVTEKGVTFQTDEYSENAQFAGIKELEARCLSNLNMFSKQLKTYIDETFKQRQEIINESVNNTPITNFIYLKGYKRNCNNCKRNVW